MDVNSKLTFFSFRDMKRLNKQILRSLSLTNTYRAPTTQITTISNGLRVASSNLNMPTLTIGLWCDCGSRYENVSNNGVAHYFEHLVFKGSKGKSRTILEEEVENKGAKLNAYTSREQTVYFAQGFSNDLDYFVDLLSNIVQNPTLSEHAIENERAVIIREMQDIEQNQEETVYDYLHEIAFRGTPLGFPILGPAKVVNTIKRQEIADFVKTHYITDRMVLAAAGGVDHEKL